MEYILETRGLTKVYGSKAAVRDVNLHIREGQIYGLIGRNGAGKTTIMRIISGLASPTGGDYTLFGKSGAEKGKMLKNVGVLIESPGLYPRFSAYENLKIKCLARGIKPDGYVEQLLEAVGLENVERKKPVGSYSLGMRQRVGIALALVGDPKLIVLDEPINGLDPQGIADVREMIGRLRSERGISIMISSHILDELAKISDAYGIINEGTLLDEFTAEELEKRTGEYIAIRASDPQKALAAVRAVGVGKAEIDSRGLLRVAEQLDQSAKMAKAVVESGTDLYEIYVHNSTLEDYYLGVTGGEKHA
ncbi:MAG: ATP-binding cassette domain-containing protein [Clostridia bacterium]|nr:ATP-binding cassette domain-containing protein [Clostridia bacterium]